MSYHPRFRRFCIFIAASTMVCFIATMSMGCYSSQTVPDRDDDEAYLELDVEPTTAKIYLDDEYYGLVEGWHKQVVPIDPGPRRLELRAEGYISQRFDLDVNQGKWLTLRVRMERTIDAPGDAGSGDDDEEDAPGDDDEEDAPGDDDGALPMPPHPNAPDTAH